MLQLKGTEPLFVGGTRFCFIHPQHPDRCVKVLRPDRTGEARKRDAQNWKRFLPPRFFDDQLKEIRAYDELISQQNPRLWEHIPEYYGTVETDMGLGIVTRLYKNGDGSWPENLEEALPNGLSPALDDAIERFLQGLLREHIVTRDLLPHNLIAVKQGEGKSEKYQVLIVDGIGNSELVPISTWFHFFAKRKIQRKIAKFRYRASILLPEAQRIGKYRCNS